MLTFVQKHRFMQLPVWKQQQQKNKSVILWFNIATRPVTHLLPLQRDVYTVDKFLKRKQHCVIHFSNCLFHYILALYNLIERFATCWGCSHWSSFTVRYTRGAKEWAGNIKNPNPKFKKDTNECTVKYNIPVSNCFTLPITKSQFKINT